MEDADEVVDTPPYHLTKIDIPSNKTWRVIRALGGLERQLKIPIDFSPFQAHNPPIFHTERVRR